MGIDAEEGGPTDTGGHGPTQVYADVVEFLDTQCVDRQERTILVIGGNKNRQDDVTRFWDRVGALTGLAVEHVNGAAAIAAADFQKASILAVVSTVDEVRNGGLTQPEHDALVSRQGDIAAFVSGGGGLMGLYSGFANPFAYLGGVGSITTTPATYTEVDPTPVPSNPIPAGFNLGPRSLWHQTFDTRPSFLEVLAVSKSTGEPAVIGGCQVSVPSPCADVTGGEPLCATDGSGDFTYTFTITNNTEEDIHHVYLLEPTAPVQLTPNYFDTTDLTGQSGKPLCSAKDATCDVKRGANRSRPLTVTIKNAAPGDVISLLVSIHERDLEECCSVKHTVELPACDCGQIVSDSSFCSFELFPRFRTRQNYSFTFQNLLGQTVNNVLITPSPGTNLTVTPNHFTGLGLAGVPSADPASGQLVRTLALSGPNAKEGNEVCFRISSHDDGYQECCSIERCLTLQCSFAFVDIHPVGGVFVDSFDRALLIRNIGPSGGDGVELDLGTADRFQATWRPVEEPELGENAHLSLSAFGLEDESGEELLSLQIQKRGEELNVRATSREGTPRSVSFIRNGLTVGELELPADAQVRVVSGGWPSGTILRAADVSVIVIWPVAALVEVVRGGESRLFLAEEVAFDLPEPAVPVAFATARLLAAGIPELALTEARGTLTDCNGNGVSDATDIAAGTSADANGDGVPDECLVLAPNLEIRLETGFDEAAGRPVAPGAPDDDWRVVVDGSRLPARRVARVNGGWNPALPGTEWISLDGERGNSIPGLDVLRFERCFCIGNRAKGASLELELFADDRASVFLNGGLIGGPGGKFNGPEPLSVRFDGLVGRSLFQRGENCLVVEVEDSGAVVTGLDLAGTVFAEEGACPMP